jgi:5-methylcytosine-specific restriction endonuclease McrA
MALTPEYVKYINSPEWKALRKKVILRDKRKCQHCGVQTRLQVHHLTYERLGHEMLSDLITLCRDCHRIEHKLPPEIRAIKKSLKPKVKPRINHATRQIIKHLAERFK